MIRKDNVSVQRFFKEGKLTSIPRKAKSREVVLRRIIIDRFVINKFYTEKEVNDILKEIYSDYAYLRRELVENNFLQRTKDCSQYWVSEILPNIIS